MRLLLCLIICGLFTITVTAQQRVIYNDAQPYTIVTKNGLEGLLDLFTGDTLVALQYDALYPTAKPGLFIMRNGNKYGFLSATDKTVLATPQYDMVYFVPGYSPYADVSLTRDCLIAYKNKKKYVFTPGVIAYRNSYLAGRKPISHYTPLPRN
jgi:hypothetical protein